MKYAVVVCLCCLCVILIILAVDPKAIVDTDTVRINQNGHRFAVYDRLADIEYNLVFVHRRRSEAQIKPSMLILTDTIRIDSIRNGFRVVSNGRVYQITRKKGVF